MKVESSVSPFKKYTVDFSNVYGIDRMILYDDHSSVVGIAMFNLEDIERAIVDFREKGGSK